MSGKLWQEQIAELKRTVEADVVSWQEAKLQIRTFHGPRVWTTVQWKELRATLLGDQCDQCASREGPFTLQHLKQPPTFRRLFRALRREHKTTRWRIYQNDHPIQLLGEKRFICPHCESTNIQSRKLLTPKWICRARGCGHDFDLPRTAIRPRRLQMAELKKARWDSFQDEYAKAYDESNDELGKKAVLASLEWCQYYLSGEDTATHCKRCAYMWDKKHCHLCPHCREQWVELWCSRCRSCDPSYVTCSSCGEFRHHNRWAVCFECSARGDSGSVAVPEDAANEAAAT
jgi:hypothetical protein